VLIQSSFKLQYYFNLCTQEVTWINPFYSNAPENEAEIKRKQMVMLTSNYNKNVLRPFTLTCECSSRNIVLTSIRITRKILCGILITYTKTFERPIEKRVSPLLPSALSVVVCESIFSGNNIINPVTISVISFKLNSTDVTAQLLCMSHFFGENNCLPTSSLLPRPLCLTEFIASGQVDFSGYRSYERRQPTRFLVAKYQNFRHEESNSNALSIFKTYEMHHCLREPENFSGINQQSYHNNSSDLAATVQFADGLRKSATSHISTIYNVPKYSSKLEADVTCPNSISIDIHNLQSIFANGKSEHDGILSRLPKHDHQLATPTFEKDNIWDPSWSSITIPIPLQLSYPLFTNIIFCRQESFMISEMFPSFDFIETFVWVKNKYNFVDHPALFHNPSAIFADVTDMQNAENGEVGNMHASIAIKEDVGKCCEMERAIVMTEARETIALKQCQSTVNNFFFVQKALLPLSSLSLSQKPTESRKIEQLVCGSIKRLMRIGVKFEAARDAVLGCLSNPAVVDFFSHALLQIRQSMLTNLSTDPYGKSLWSPRISARITSWMPNVLVGASKDYHTGYVMVVSYSRLIDNVHQQWHLTLRYSDFRTLSRKLSKFLPSSLSGQFGLNSKMSTLISGCNDKVRQERMIQVDRWLKELLCSGSIMTVPEVAETIMETLEIETRGSD